MSSKKITNVIGRMVFDSRGYPTVEAEVEVNPRKIQQNPKKMYQKYSKISCAL